MKAKLLKKIRKRYEIKRVESIASNAGINIRNAVAMFGLPFFILIDKDDDSMFDGITQEYFKTFDAARIRLHEWIISDYGEKFRHKDEVSTKVWWK